MTNYAYTNHYFHPNSLGEIYITTSGLNTSGNSIRITLYRKRIIGKENIDSWTGNPQTIGGVIGQNLDPNEFYFFMFETLNNITTVNGGGYIYQP